MITTKSTVPEILEYLNLPIDTTIFSASTLPEIFYGSYIYIKYVGDNKNRNEEPEFGISSIFVESSNGSIDEVHPHYMFNDNGGPVRIDFHDNGEVSVLWGHGYGVRDSHVDRRARLKRYRKDSVIEEVYYLKDNVHNSTGPAHRYMWFGSWQNIFYLYGDRVSKDFFFNLMEHKDTLKCKFS